MTQTDTVSSNMERLGNVPLGRDVALVLRHAERAEIPAGTFGVDVPLTHRGKASAERLGALLAGTTPGTMVTSPVPRCIQTCEAVRHGCGWKVPIERDTRLGAHGPFVTAPEISGQLFLELGILEMVERQLTASRPPLGMRPISDGMRILLGLVARNLEGRGRLNLYVTHDAILAVLVGRLFRLPLEAIGWPDYLEGLLLWRVKGRLHCAWRQLQQASDPVGGQGDGL